MKKVLTVVFSLLSFTGLLASSEQFEKVEKQRIANKFENFTKENQIPDDIAKKVIKQDLGVLLATSTAQCSVHS